jgi:hypothetical protein
VLSVRMLVACTVILGNRAVPILNDERALGMVLFARLISPGLQCECEASYWINLSAAM